MKKTLTLLTIAVTLMTVSCSNDDSPANLTKEVTGTYSGYTSASCAYFSGSMSADQKVVISEGSSANKVNVNYESTTWGTVSISDATVGESDQGYILSGSGKWSMGHNGNTNEYDCTFTGVIKSGESQFTFSSPSVMGGLKVEFTEGEIPADLVIPGSYKGWTDAACAYFQGMTAENQTVTISVKDDKYSLVYTSDTWGEFSAEDLKVTYSDGVFSLTGDGICKMGMNGNVSEYPCSVSGSVDVEKSAPAFVITVPGVMGGLKITFTNGDKPSESTNE